LGIVLRPLLDFKQRLWRSAWLLKHGTPSTKAKASRFDLFLDRFKGLVHSGIGRYRSSFLE
jgi:hypothetical protein